MFQEPKSPMLLMLLSMNTTPTKFILDTDFPYPQVYFLAQKKSNLIVVLLIGESKFFASESSLSGDAYYDEYVDRSRILRNPSALEPKIEKKLIKPSYHEQNVKRACHVEDKVVSVTERLVEEIIEVKKERVNLGSGGHELVLPTEELKKRADDFIARVNRQRRLEARLLY
ncbi:hypothetical protein CCACVL1_10957 [Corchorus capsularis]|uniref:Uncharacterized protein n=1 Tax=Corchorus capsularis TaxID=210143 RepID=A0A1R3INK5_COCAP|nr:hypothetical protein CCACVL1_10957 [Corchorus capsularis]